MKLDVGKLHLNGIQRNLVRFKKEHKHLAGMPDGQPEDWLKKPWDLHAYVDMFVESSEYAPYLMGHWWAVYFPVSLLAIIILL